MDEHLRALAAEFLAEYADRLGNDGCNDWKWPDDMPEEVRAFLRGPEAEPGEWPGKYGPPNWWVVRRLVKWLRGEV